MTWIREKILVQLFNTTILQNGITYWEGAVTLANFYRQRKEKKKIKTPTQKRPLSLPVVSSYRINFHTKQLSIGQR